MTARETKPAALPTYPSHARAERIADNVIHTIGVILAITGAVVLIFYVAGHGGAATDLGPTGGGIGGGHIAAVFIYAAALIATFTASACYHMTPWEKARPTLRRIDHAAIYLKIAGTYTPLVVLIGSAFAYAILGLVWMLALGGALAKLFFWRNPGRAGTLIYLFMGWLSVALVWPMIQTLPTGAIALVVAGGLLYSAGVIFFVSESLRFSKAIWHGFVLAASVCFFIAIALGITHEIGMSVIG
jgi:hemolysin III